MSELKDEVEPIPSFFSALVFAAAVYLDLRFEESKWYRLVLMYSRGGRLKGHLGTHSGQGHKSFLRQAQACTCKQKHRIVFKFT